MQFVITIPETSIVDFEHRSPELLQFIAELIRLFERITDNYVQFNGQKLFFAHVRDGVRTFYSTDTGNSVEFAPVATGEKPLKDQITFPADEPGDWTIAELFIEGWGGRPWGSLVLRSRDFRPAVFNALSAKQLVENVLRFLEKRSFRVPETGLKVVTFKTRPSR